MLAQKQTLSIPQVLQTLREWLIGQRHQTAEGISLARAINYILKRWEAAVRYFERGHATIQLPTEKRNPSDHLGKVRPALSRL